MKKCPYCKKEIADDTSFCGYCGKELTKDNTDNNFSALYEIAMAYLGNKKVAKEFAKEYVDKNNAIRELGKKCVSYIQERNINLFQDERISKGTKELEAFNNFENEIASFDYEERIVSIMKVKEDLSSYEIADILGISEDSVKAILESAYNKVNPKFETIKIKNIENVEKPKPKRKAIIKKIGILLGIILLTILLGFFALKQYAQRQYVLGIESREANDNEKAIKHLRRAVRFDGANSESEIALANLYYETGDFLSASIRYEDYINAGGDAKRVNESLSLAYDELALEEIKKSSISEAIDYLRKEYKITGDDKLNNWIDALQGGEVMYKDEYGNEYNQYGKPVFLKGLCENGEVYNVEIQYEDKLMSVIKVDDTLLKDFVMDEDAKYELYFYPKNNSSRYYINKSIYKNDLLIRQEILNNKDQEVINYEYEYDENNRSSKRLVKDNQNIITEYIYGEDGMLIQEITTNKEERIRNTIYKYEEGILKEITDIYTQDKNNIRKTIYQFTGMNRPYKATILDGNNKEIAKGIFIRDNGWIFLYNQ